jgi:prepilin-type N-terminal cleavage/methylation domain-containing protein/prepilin-type processing-associated H-X9-DG protein
LERAPALTRLAFTFVELLVVIAIVGVLLAISIPAIQKVRSAADRVQCSNQIRQLGLALIRYHDERGSLPMGTTLNLNMDYPYMTWMTRLLSYIEQDTIWQQALTDYERQRNPFRPAPHVGLAAMVKLFSCPSDPRGPGPHWTNRNRLVGVTSFVGVLGTDHLANGGVLYRSSKSRFEEITDGTSHTLLVGERPPSADFWFGWWYAGVGMGGTGSPDSVLGVREVRTLAPYTEMCERGPFHFVPGRLTNQCDVFHYWSLHTGGANFVMCDGSVHFLSYSADAILPALATRAGNEAVEVP